MALDVAYDAYLSRLSERLRGVFVDNLVGVYLHGSAALGDFQPSGPDASDLDVLAVCARPLADGEKRAVAGALAHEVLPCPAIGWSSTS